MVRQGVEFVDGKILKRKTNQNKEGGGSVYVFACV